MNIDRNYLFYDHFPNVMAQIFHMRCFCRFDQRGLQQFTYFSVAMVPSVSSRVWPDQAGPGRGVAGPGRAGVWPAEPLDNATGLPAGHFRAPDAVPKHGPKSSYQLKVIIHANQNMENNIPLLSGWMLVAGSGQMGVKNRFFVFQKL